MDIYEFISEVQTAMSDAFEEALIAAYDEGAQDGYVQGLDAAQIIADTVDESEPMCDCGCGMTAEEAEYQKDLLESLISDHANVEIYEGTDPVDLILQRIEALEENAGLKYTGPK